jgi:uncharacterized membrane protein
VGLSVLAGVAMLIGGIRILKTQYHVFGEGLIGGGIATLYFAVFAAFHFFHLIDVGSAFILMSLITIAAGGMAVGFDSILVAVLGLVGGYGTPIMLSTGVVTFVGLFSYVLLLGCGVLAISYKKQWHLLNYVCFFGTYGLFFMAMQSYQVTDFWRVMPFLTAYFILFSTMVFLFNLVSRSRSTLLEPLGLLVNAGLYFAVSYGLVGEAFGYRRMAVVTLALAAFYVAHVWYFLVRRLLDRELLFCFFGLAAFFLAVTVPLIFSDQWITVSWALEALVILWIAGKLQSEFLRHVAYLLYMIVVGRFCFLDLPTEYAQDAVYAGNIPVGEYLFHMLQRFITFGIPIASLGGAFRLLGSPATATFPAVDKANDMAEFVPRRGALLAAVIGAVAMLFLFLHLELNRSFLYMFPPIRLPMLTLLWIAMCGFLLYEYLVQRSDVLLGLLAVFACGLLLKLFVIDLPSWTLTERLVFVPDGMLFGGGYSPLAAAMRLLDFGLIIAFFSLAFQRFRGGQNPAPARYISAGTALVLLFTYLSLELNTLLGCYVPGLQAGGISILWSLFAIGLLLGGIWRRVRALRFVALALFAVVVWKVFFVDLSELESLYRIIAFLVLGVLVLCGSLIYMKYRQAFATSPVPAAEEKP